MANYPEHEYDAADTELYQTNLYGGTDADLDNTAPVDDTDGFTSTIDCSTKIGCRLAFKFTGSGSTDNLVLTLYESLSSSWDGDEKGIEYTISNDGTETIWPYVLDWGPGYYRWAMQSSGATDTFDIDVQVRYFRYEIVTA